MFKLFKSKEKKVFDFEKWKEEIGIPESKAKEDELLQKFGSKWCPFMNSQCILDRCVHFRSPNVVFYETRIIDSDYNPNWCMSPPKCKLWS